MPQNEARSNPGLTISVLNPTSTFSDDINQNSIVLKMTYGNVSFLFMGDAMPIPKAKLPIAEQIFRQISSSSSAFLSKVQPKISLIEVGAGNSYGHPTSATLGRLA